MRKFLVAIGFVIFAVAVFAAVAYRALLLPHERPKATTISLPLEFSMQLDKAEFQEGETINANLTVMNTSNKTIVVTYWLFFDLVVDDVNGTRVWNWQSFHVHPDSVFERTLDPSARLSYNFGWDQTVPYEGAAGPYPAGQVPKGTYFIKATFDFTLNMDDRATSQSLETPTITFTIK